MKSSVILTIALAAKDAAKRATQEMLEEYYVPSLADLGIELGDLRVISFIRALPYNDTEHRELIEELTTYLLRATFFELGDTVLDILIAPWDRYSDGELMSASKRAFPGCVNAFFVGSGPGAVRITRLADLAPYLRKH